MGKMIGTTAAPACNQFLCCQQWMTLTLTFTASSWNQLHCFSAVVGSGFCAYADGATSDLHQSSNFPVACLKVKVAANVNELIKSWFSFSSSNVSVFVLCPKAPPALFSCFSSWHYDTHQILCLHCELYFVVWSPIPLGIFCVFSVQHCAVFFNTVHNTMLHIKWKPTKKHTFLVFRCFVWPVVSTLA